MNKHTKAALTPAQERPFTVFYEDWDIPVEAANRKQAVYRAWLRFTVAHSISFIDFARHASAGA